MSFSDEVLMAYADGELAEPARSEVARAVQADPQVAARVAKHRALRENVFQAFAGVLKEPVPARLRAVAASAKVVHLSAVRATRQQAAGPTLPSQMLPSSAPRTPRAWHRWGGVAAALVIGLLLGGSGLYALQGGTDAVALAQVGGTGGALVAEGRLDAALSRQLSMNGPVGPVRIGVSFLSKEGVYCRSFQLDAAAGLACRQGGRWQIPLLAQTPARARESGAYRQAGSDIPAVVLDAIDQRIVGAAMDARDEQVALRQGWKH